MKPVKRSGTHRIDFSSVHEDERSAREPWDALVACKEGKAELTLPGADPVKRPLPVEDVDGAVEDALREWFGEAWVSHWVKLRALPVTNGRTLWKLDAHMTALGLDPKDSAMRAQVASDMARLAALEITIYTPREELRLRAPLMTALATTERKRHGAWVLDDMVVRMHPALGEPRLRESGFPPEAPTEPGVDMPVLPPMTDPPLPMDMAVNDEPTVDARSPRGSV